MSILFINLGGIQYLSELNYETTHGSFTLHRLNQIVLEISFEAADTALVETGVSLEDCWRFKYSVLQDSLKKHLQFHFTT